MILIKTILIEIVIYFKKVILAFNTFLLKTDFSPGRNMTITIYSEWKRRQRLGRRPEDKGGDPESVDSPRQTSPAHVGRRLPNHGRKAEGIDSGNDTGVHLSVIIVSRLVLCRHEHLC